MFKLVLVCFCTLGIIGCTSFNKQHEVEKYKLTKAELVCQKSIESKSKKMEIGIEDVKELVGSRVGFWGLKDISQYMFVVQEAGDNFVSSSVAFVLKPEEQGNFIESDSAAYVKILCQTGRRELYSDINMPVKFDNTGQSDISLSGRVVRSKDGKIDKNLFFGGKSTSFFENLESMEQGILKGNNLKIYKLSDDKFELSVSTRMVTSGLRVNVKQKRIYQFLK